LSASDERREPPKSFRELPPLDAGGVVARRGLSFQDHVAVAFCLDMLRDEGPAEVWCETQDDIVLFWADNDCVEYVQVKTTTMPEWTIAHVCRREGGKGSSLIERSLLRDRARERAMFRIVTSTGLHHQLRPLLRRYDAANPSTPREKLIALAERLAEKLGDGCVSPNGNGIEYWVMTCQWDVKHAESAVRNDNLVQIMKAANDQGQLVTIDQVEEAYQKLLRMVRDAAAADYQLDRGKKVIHNTELRSWLSHEFRRAFDSWRLPPGGTLIEKLRAAGIVGTELDGATRARARYRAERLKPRYLDDRQIGALEAEIEAGLRLLRSRVDAETLPDHGRQIHSQSLECVQTALRTLGLGDAPTHIGQGFMYELADRCVHRFRRVGPS
jgi:hypothetical protein